MLFRLTIGLVTIILALNGLLFQTKKEPSGAASWSNLNTTGRLLLILILSLGMLNLTKGYIDDQNNAAVTAKKDGQINNLEKSQDDLLQTNQHLIKVMSVASGYNAVIRGAISFTRPVSEIEFRHAAENLFIKYVEVELRAHNRLGEYRGKVDYGTHPILWKFRNLSEISDDMSLAKYREVLSEESPNRRFFYEVKCSNLKILSPDKIQYAKLGSADDVQVNVKEFSYSGDFGQLYDVRAVFIDEVEIEELGKYRVNELLRY